MNKWIFVPMEDTEAAEKIESDVARGRNAAKVYLFFSLLGTTNSPEGKIVHATGAETTDKYIYARLNEIVLVGSDGSVRYRHPVINGKIGQKMRSGLNSSGKKDKKNLGK